MVHPVPGAWSSAGYLQRGRHWSLGRNAAGLGLHTGRDYAAAAGTPIVSATHGHVIAANAYDASYGYKVIIEWDGLEVWYCHMPKNAATVRAGDLVEAGQRIGAVGATGNVTGAHLHMELRVKGGRFALGTFRDPARAVNFKPKPIKWQTVNIADNHKTGIATQGARRRRLLTDLMRANPTVTLFQEAPVAGIYRWLTANIPARPRGRKQKQREIAGASGRRMWANKRVTHQRHGKTVPAVRGEGGRAQPFTWTYDLIDGYRPRLSVNIHGPFGIARKHRRAYYNEVFAWVNRKRVDLGLSWRHVVIGGDFNCRAPALNAAKKYGLVDAMSIAKKRRHRLFKSTNSWRRRLIPGKRIDYFIVAKSLTVLEVRNTRTRWNGRKTHTTQDHNRQILVTA